VPQPTSVEIVVPASIGNLGPGFDTIGLAVRLYLRVRVTRVVDDGAGRLACRFENLRLDGPNGIQRGFAALEPRRRRRASLEVAVRSDIPVGAGLGSSAAAFVAGLRLRELVDGRRSCAELLAAACRLEGHPDNVAAALYGGVTSSCVREDGSVSVAKWRWPKGWRIVVATPAMRLATSVSRRALPRAVPLADAVFNLQRVTLLLRALETRAADELREALRDRWHQPYRERLVPALNRLLALRHPDVLGVCLSGAGPSVVAFARRNVGAVERLMARAYAREKIACTVRTLEVHQKGCR
jgi:homoserine kinase